MSKISLSPSPTGSAVYTIASPAGSTDRTLNLPDAAGTVFVGGQALSATTGSFSGNVTLGSSVLETPTGSAPAYLCRAWVNFNGTGTVAIRASGNVSSITDNGTGNYTVNFATAMPDANYAATISVQETIATEAFFNRVGSIDSCATVNVRVNTFGPNSSTLFDVEAVHVTIFR